MQTVFLLMQLKYFHKKLQQLHYKKRIQIVYWSSTFDLIAQSYLLNLKSKRSLEKLRFIYRNSNIENDKLLVPGSPARGPIITSIKCANVSHLIKETVDKITYIKLCRCCKSGRTGLRFKIWSRNIKRVR